MKQQTGDLSWRKTQANFSEVASGGERIERRWYGKLGDKSGRERREPARNNRAEMENITSAVNELKPEITIRAREHEALASAGDPTRGERAAPEQMMALTPNSEVMAAKRSPCRALKSASSYNNTTNRRPSREAAISRSQYSSDGVGRDNEAAIGHRGDRGRHLARL